jgi:hypothetical protein
MADEPDHVVLVFLRRIDERTQRIADDLQDLKVRTTAVEEGLAGVNRRTTGRSNGLSGSSCVSTWPTLRSDTHG